MADYVVKVDDRFYAEYADGSAYLTKERTRASRFADRRVAKLVAGTVTGAVVSYDGYSKPRVDRA